MQKTSNEVSNLYSLMLTKLYICCVSKFERIITKYPYDENMLELELLLNGKYMYSQHSHFIPQGLDTVLK
jgi:hypothetical protein